jgi:SPP1 gp7 family putative phage head morphogenesis protein
MHHHAHLRELSADPTNTQDLRERFLLTVRRRFRDLRGAVRKVVGYEEDRLHLRQNSRLADADNIERFPSEQGKVRAFIEWFREQIAEDVLEPVSRRTVRRGEHWTARFVRAAAGQAWEDATSRLQERGVDVPDSDIEAVFQLGVPRRQLRRLYTRAYSNLETVTEEAAPQVRDVLTRGLAEGVNPREMARRLTKEVRTVQKKRAEVLARTETIHSYSEMTVTRYEQAGVDKVQHGEWTDSDDDRVCLICSRLDGREVPMAEVREATFTFEPRDDEPDHLAGEYPLMPPAHPSGRCALLPVVS